VPPLHFASLEFALPVFTYQNVSMPINLLPRLLSRPVTTAVGVLIVFLIARKVDMPTLRQFGWTFRALRGRARRNLCERVEETSGTEAPMSDATLTTSNDGKATPSASDSEAVEEPHAQSDASKHSSGCSQCTDCGSESAHDGKPQEEQAPFDVNAHLRDVFRENGIAPYMIQRFMQDSDASQDDVANDEAARQSVENNEIKPEKNEKEVTTEEDCPDGTESWTREGKEVAAQPGVDRDEGYDVEQRPERRDGQ
jgi:hypothetical protein